MKNNEHEDLEENRSRILRTEGAGTNTEVVDRRNATHAPTNPFTSHKVDVNVPGQRTSEKQKQLEVDEDCQYMTNRLSRFTALYDKSE